MLKKCTKKKNPRKNLTIGKILLVILCIRIVSKRLTLDFDKLQLEYPEIVKKYLKKDVDTTRLYVNKLELDEQTLEVVKENADR